MARMILATQDDLSHLAQLIECALRFQPIGYCHLGELKEELNTARVVAPEEMPSDIVTLNSEVKVRDLDSGHEGVYKVIFPREAHALDQSISVLGPVGSALLGHRAGEILELKTLAGKKHLKVQQVMAEPQAACRAA